MTAFLLHLRFCGMAMLWSDLILRTAPGGLLTQADFHVAALGYRCTKCHGSVCTEPSG